MGADKSVVALTEISYDDPADADKLHQCFDFEISMLQSDVFDGRAIAPIGSRDKPKPGAVWFATSFKQFIAGSGSAGTAPDFDKLLLNAGLQETVVGSTSVTYTTDGTMVGSIGAGADDGGVDIEMAVGDQQLQVAGGCRGNIQFHFRQGERAEVWADGFQGTYTEPTEAALGDSLATRAEPQVCKALTATVAAKTVVLKELIINLNNEVLVDKGIAETNGVDAVILVDNNPTIEALFRTPDFSDINIANKFTTEAKIAFALVLGATAGNILTLSVDGYMNAPPVQENVGGVMHTRISCDMSWVVADTQLTLVFT